MTGDSPRIRSGAGWIADAVAGTSMAGLLLPEAVAYSGIAGMPPQAGVLALFAGLLVYALIGRSRFAIVSATSSSAAVLGATTLSLAGHDVALRAALAAGLVLATGAAFLAAGAARLGSICSFISKPVLRGFSFGLGLVIVLKQLPNMTEVHPSDAMALQFGYELLENFAQWNWVAMALGVGALIALKSLARFRKVPGALLVIAMGIAVGQLANAHGYDVKVVGPITLFLAPPSLPILSHAQWLSLCELSLALLLLLFAESYGAIRAMAMKHGDSVDPNRDLLAFGAANLVSGLIHGMPVGAGYSATSANEAAGAVSRRAAVAAAGVVFVLVAVFLQDVQLTPIPVLAAVVVHAVSHSLTLETFKPYFAWRRDRLVVVSAAIAVIVLGVLNGLLAGIAVSLAMTLRGLSQPRLSELGRQDAGHDFLSIDGHHRVAAIDGLLILRPEAPLFFANVDKILAAARALIETRCPRAVVLSLEETPDLDGTSIEAIQAFGAEQRRAGVKVVLARLKDPVVTLLQPDLAEAAGLILEAGSIDDAVGRLRS